MADERFTEKRFEEEDYSKMEKRLINLNEKKKISLDDILSIGTEYLIFSIPPDSCSSTYGNYSATEFRTFLNLVEKSQYPKDILNFAKYVGTKLSNSQYAYGRAEEVHSRFTIAKDVQAKTLVEILRNVIGSEEKFLKDQSSLKIIKQISEVLYNFDLTNREQKKEEMFQEFFGGYGEIKENRPASYLFVDFMTKLKGVGMKSLDDTVKLKENFTRCILKYGKKAVPIIKAKLAKFD